MSAPPIPATWDGEVFRPLPRFARICDSHFVVGERYALIEHQDRSRNTHNHYFATLQETFDNLPETEDRFPTVEHLRAWALIRAGYANSQTVVCESAAEARRFIATAKSLEPLCVVTVRDNVATVFTAKSQSMKAMGAREFQDSKTKVMEVCANLLGVEPAALTSARAA